MNRLESLKNGKFQKVIVSKEMQHMISGGGTYASTLAEGTDSDTYNKTGTGTSQTYDHSHREGGTSTYSTSKTLPKGHEEKWYKD